MTTALYRTNGGEVLKISLTNQQFDQRDTDYWTVAADPAFPDGIELREDETGPMRVLGFAKVFDAGSCRNATQPEIDGWPAAQTADENLMDRDGAKDLFQTHPRFRKMMIAFADVLKGEINILRAEHGLGDRTLAQLKTAMLNRMSEDD